MGHLVRELEQTIAVAVSGGEPSDAMWAAQAHLAELRSNPESLPLFMATISASQNVVARRFCILTVDRFVKSSELPTSTRQNLLPEIIQRITSETDYVNRMNLCVVASQIHLRDGDDDAGDDDEPDLTTTDSENSSGMWLLFLNKNWNIDLPLIADLAQNSATNEECC
jgi:hypothetical protein